MPHHSFTNVVLQSGQVVPRVDIAYSIYGELNEKRNNLVVFPTYFTGRQRSNEPFFGTGRAIDPARHCILVPCLIGNGESSSPSNTDGAHGGARFPRFTIHDNVRLQRALIDTVCPVDQIALVTGWSMGGLQTFEWAVQFPEFVKTALPFCATAKCSPHNHVFLEGVKAALTADQNWNGGAYAAPPERGLRAFGRAYAGWAYSSAYFDDALYRQRGFDSVEAVLVDWEEDHLGWDANDLMCKLWSWQNADVSATETFNGDVKAALQSIQARMIVMPCTTDMYFDATYSQREASLIPNAEFRAFDSPYGHCASTPSSPDPDFMAFYDRAVTDLMDA